MNKFFYYFIRFNKLIKKLFFENKSEVLTNNSSYTDDSFVIPEGAIELNCEAAPVYNNRKGIVTIISDDGYFNSVKLLEEIFAQYDLKCSVAGIIRWVKKNEKQWKTTISKGHIELVNHSYDHIKMSEDSLIANDLLMLEREISDSFLYLKKRFNIPSICFVCPENQMCSSGYDILKKNGVYAVRRGDRGLNSLSPNYGIGSGDWLNLKTCGIMDPGCSNNIRNGWVDNAIEDNKWLIEMWHNVSYTSDNFYQTILKEDAVEHLKYIKAKDETEDIWVASFSDATKYLYERQESTIKAYYYNSKIYIKVILDESKFNLDTFNHPLTIIINLSNKFGSNDNLNNKMIKNIVPGVLYEFSVE